MTSSRMILRAVAALTLTTAVASSGFAQSWSVAVDLQNGAASATGSLSEQTTNVITGASASLQVTCSPNVDCNSVTAKIVKTTGGQNTLIQGIDQKTKSRTTTSFEIPQTAAAGADRFLQLETPTNTLLLAPVGTSTSTTTPRPPPPEPTADGRTLFELSTRPCPATLEASPYDEDANLARILVSPLGNRLSLPPKSIDENDVIQVIVVADSALLPRLKVRRTSAFRTTGGIRIVGQDVDLTGLRDSLRRQAAEELPPCGSLTVDLADFAPGKGQIEIAAQKADGEEVLGTVDVGVNPLYTGAFSLGVIRTKLLDPAFGLRFNGTDSIITVTEDNVQGIDSGDHRIEYALLYTPFVWGRRDLEKDTPFGLNHLNPTIGLVLNDVADNFLAGVSADVLGSIYFTAGAHAGRVRQLDSRSGLSVGSAFDGPRTAIPTVKQWRTEFFLGVSVDVRAAVQLLRLVVVGKNSS